MSRSQICQRRRCVVVLGAGKSAFAGGGVPSSGRKQAESEAVKIQGQAHGSHPAKCHLTEKPIRSGLTSSQPKYSPAVFPTGDASRMEGESRRDMIRNGRLI